MTDKQKLFIKILKSGKFTKNWTSWGPLDQISEIICKLGHWQANYKDLFDEKDLSGNLPVINGEYLIEYAKTHTIKQITEEFIKLFKGQ